MSVRAKFWVKSVNVVSYGTGPNEGKQADVVMAPVYDKSNADWSKATPSGEIKMTITNPAAFEQFEPGKQYFVDFTPA